VVSEHLEFGVGNVPIFVRSAFFEDELPLNHAVDLVFTKEESELDGAYILVAALNIEFIILIYYIFTFSYLDFY
jgi:hypothetical protein